MTRLIMGHVHIHLIHGCLLRGEDAAHCHSFDMSYIVRHFADLDRTRDQDFKRTSLYDIFIGSEAFAYL